MRYFWLHFNQYGSFTVVRFQAEESLLNYVRKENLPVRTGKDQDAGASWIEKLDLDATTLVTLKELS